MHCITEALKILGARNVNNSVDGEASTKLCTLSVEAQQTLLELANSTAPLSNELPHRLFEFFHTSHTFLSTDITGHLYSTSALALILWKDFPRTDAMCEYIIQAVKDSVLTDKEEQELAVNALSLANREELSVSFLKTR